MTFAEFAWLAGRPVKCSTTIPVALENVRGKIRLDDTLLTDFEPEAVLKAIPGKPTRSFRGRALSSTNIKTAAEWGSRRLADALRNYYEVLGEIPIDIPDSDSESETETEVSQNGEVRVQVA